MIAEDMQSQSDNQKSPFLFYNLEDWQTVTC
jgi:hypothetical protein